MALKDITAKIAADAQARAQEIVADAQARAQEIAADAQAQCKDLARTADAALADTFAQEERVALSRARRTAAAIIANAQRERVDAALASAYAQLCNDADFVRAFLQKRVDLLPHDAQVAVVRVAPRHMAIAQELSLPVAPTEDANVPDGMIVETPAANYDMTISSVVAQQRSALERAAAEELFAQ